MIESVGNAAVATPDEVASLVNTARRNQEPAILLRINRKGSDRYVALRLG